jgi:hypothetical protein
MKRRDMLLKRIDSPGQRVKALNNSVLSRAKVAKVLEN